MVSKFNVLLFVVYIFVVDIVMEYGVIFVFLWIERIVIWRVDCYFIWGVV